MAAAARPKYLAQWAATGQLNAQIEEAFTGHAIVKAFGRQHEVEERFREHARQHAEIAAQRYWVNNLFRGATNHGAYDSQMGVAYLVHALARLGTLERAGSSPIPPDYTAR